MKKALLIFTVLFSAVSYTNAQCTPDNSQTKVGVSPKNLPTACHNTAYDETITVTIKKDTMIWGQNFTFDSARITNVTNLHNGFTYTCHNSDCFIELKNNALAHGCVSILGTPLETGTKAIKVEYKAYINGQVITNSRDVDVTVKPSSDSECTPTSIFDIQTKSNTLGVFPNPSNGEELNFSSTLHNISVVDQLGNVIYTSEEANSIQLSKAKKGIYFLKADEGIEKIIIK